VIRYKSGRCCSCQDRKQGYCGSCGNWLDDDNAQARCLDKKIKSAALKCCSSTKYTDQGNEQEVNALVADTRGKVGRFTYGWCKPAYITESARLF